jgi:hypothetical protein
MIVHELRWLSLATQSCSIQSTPHRHSQLLFYQHCPGQEDPDQAGGEPNRQPSQQVQARKFRNFRQERELWNRDKAAQLARQEEEKQVERENRQKAYDRDHT